MSRLTEKVAGVPAWSYGAIAAILVLAWGAFRRQPKGAAAASTPSLVIVETPQSVTPYDLPVTRSGAPTSSTIPERLRFTHPVPAVPS